MILKTTKHGSIYISPSAASPCFITACRLFLPKRGRIKDQR